MEENPYQATDNVSARSAPQDSRKLMLTPLIAALVVVALSIAQAAVIFVAMAADALFTSSDPLREIRWHLLWAFVAFLLSGALFRWIHHLGRSAPAVALPPDE